ncbi:SMP-30/gluconolactonase/LRE family protein [Zavarzinia sp. CC-PAN008]|uniref:SMP-30/gluconolactonase/LRE family protein n=1 Tax=Zavarzinia sp. CC-PAN008 TaxID=3243332 RepID=UPI003F744378
MERIATGFGLIEGPNWIRGHGFIASDVHHGGVWSFQDPAKPVALIPHRKGVGGIAPHAAGGAIISGRNIGHKPFPGESSTGRIFLEQDAATGRTGFNDLTTDATGRIYAGSLGLDPFGDHATGRAGHLWLIELDGSARQVADDVMLTNGIGLSPDGRRLYHADTLRQRVNAHDVAPDGTLGPRQVLAAFGEEGPDGLAVATDGTVWVALARGGRVAVVDPAGREVRSIPVPQRMVTSVCFGGDDLRTLYVVTGSDGSGGDRAGSVYRLPVDIAGVPRAPARVAL